MSDEDVEIDNACIEEFDISPTSVIFLTSEENWCKHCETMEPVVKKVEDEGYTFVTVTYEKIDENIIGECFSDKMDKGAPQFICAGSGESLVGTVKEKKLFDFAKECK